MAALHAFNPAEFPDGDEEQLRALARKLGLPWPADGPMVPGTIGILKAAWKYRNFTEYELLEKLERASEQNERQRRIRDALDDDPPRA